MKRIVLGLFLISNISCLVAMEEGNSSKASFDESINTLQTLRSHIQQYEQSTNPNPTIKEQTSFLEKYTVTFDDTTKKKLDKISADFPVEIKMFLRKLSMKRTNSLVLVGPQGFGKTTLAQAIAHHLKWRCIFVPTSKLLNEYQHSGNANINRIFEEIKTVSTKEKIVLIFDEMNCFSLKQKNNKDDAQNTVNDAIQSATALWQALDDLQITHNYNVLFIGTVNDINSLPKSLKDRFSKQSIIEMSSIPMHKRISILEDLIQEIELPKDATCNKELCTLLAQKSDGCSIRHLECIIERAIDAYLEEDILINNNNAPTPMSSHHFEEGLERMKALEKKMEDKTISEQERLHREAMDQQLMLHRAIMFDQSRRETVQLASQFGAWMARALRE